MFVVMRILVLAIGVQGGIEVRKLGCSELNYCNGHGKCVSVTIGSPTMRCECFDGWGSENDVAIDRMIDCSQRTCPGGIALGELPRKNNEAHPKRECSNNGLCDRRDGTCRCFPGFIGAACERRGCPKDCSGHGQCLAMRDLAKIDGALPLSNNSLNNISYDASSQRSWDARISMACLCDSSWTVGLGPNERQEPEYFGPDCSLRHCPSANDLATENDELNCFNISQSNSGPAATGARSNLCHVDCANRGICNYKKGECTCFDGFTGSACERRS